MIGSVLDLLVYGFLFLPPCFLPDLNFGRETRRKSDMNMIHRPL